MLGILLPLTFAGFVIFVMVDSQKRFHILKEQDPEAERSITVTHALMMTLMVMFVLFLLQSSALGFASLYPDRAAAIKASMGMK